MGNNYIKGINYPKELLVGRIADEGNVIGCIWNDLLIIDDNKLEISDFITEEGRFYFLIADKMKKSKYNSLKEVDILTSNLSAEIMEQFNNYGGYESIQNIMDTMNTDNVDTYIDNLRKSNIILKLYDYNYNLLKPIQINKNINDTPINYFKNLDSSEVIAFYESQLADLSTNHVNGIISDDFMYFDDNFFNSLKQDTSESVHFSTAGHDERGNIIECFPQISNNIGGFSNGTFNIIGGYSSAGKTTAWINIIMSLLTQDKKILIISNEQTREVFYLSVLSWIMKKHFNADINKNKLRDTDSLKPLQKSVFKKAVEYFNDNYLHKLEIVCLYDANINTVNSIIRQRVLKNNVNVVLYDTFKLDTSNFNTNDAAYLKLIQDSRKFDTIAKKYNIIMLASLQLAEYTKGKLFLDASVLSMSKQIKEVLEVLLLMRNVYPEELDKTTKYYCNPYNEENSGGTPCKIEYTADENSIYRMIFIEKSRSGQNSADNGIAYLLKFFGDTGTFEEVAKCRPKHLTMQ